MSLTLKRIIMVVLGLMGAFLVWPCLLTLQYFQNSFHSYMLFSLAQGIIFGLVFGAIFGSFEGIVVSSRPKALHGLLFGALAGIAAGVIGVISGQSFLFYAADVISKTNPGVTGFSLIVANGIGWMLIGTFIAMIEGMRARSFRKLLVGLAGGIIGGIVGGITLQAFIYALPGNRLGLLAGLLLFALSLSFFYSFFENRFSFGSIKVLNGPLKNKEYHLVKTKMSVGSGNACDIVLNGYKGVEQLHALITVKKGRVSINAASKAHPISVNDARIEVTVLRREDVFAVGNAKFMFGHFS